MPAESLEEIIRVLTVILRCEKIQRQKYTFWFGEKII